LVDDPPDQGDGKECSCIHLQYNHMLSPQTRAEQDISQVGYCSYTWNF